MWNDAWDAYDKQPGGASVQSTGTFSGPTHFGQTWGSYPAAHDPWLTFHDGGLVPGAPGTEVEATLEGGEYVIPADVVARVGRKAFDRITGRARGPVGIQLQTRHRR